VRATDEGEAGMAKTDQPWRGPGWWTSPFNFLPEVRGGMQLPARVAFHDVTLRDGEQTPGVVFRKDDKKHIATLLDEAGLDRIEVAMPAVSREDAEAVAEVARLGLRADIYAFCRATAADIDVAADCGAGGVVIEVPAGVPRLRHQFPDWTADTVAAKSVAAIRHARARGLSVVFFLMDLSRAEIDFVDRLLTRVAEDAPPDSIAVVDTSGCLLPQATDWLVRHVRRSTGLPVEIHTHTDLGLGVANALAAVAAGASVVHASVLGLGERTGNAPLEEVATAVHTLYACETGIALARLTELSEAVSGLAGFPRARNKPVTGTRTFVRESGMGIELIHKEPLALFCIDPQLVGQRAGFVLGKKSGMGSIALKLEELGLDATEAQRRKLLEGVKELGTKKRDLVTDDEFTTLHRSVVARTKEGRVDHSSGRAG
jgi:isopropylmalate/homocitrate/citramalate synthase